MNSGSRRDEAAAAVATALTSATADPGQGDQLGMTARRPPRARAAIVGELGTSSLARQCSEPSTGRNPQSASKVVSATSSSGLWNGSLNVRVESPCGRPAASSASKPARAWAGVGCACSDSGLGGQHLHQEGEPVPEALPHRGPEEQLGFRRDALSRAVPSTRTLGSSACAPIHNSA